MNQLAGSVVLLSGGMDSTTAFYKALAETDVKQALSFDYGQRHKVELEYAMRTASKEGIPHALINIRTVGYFMKDSALTGDVDVPHGHYAEDNMKQTIVPNRNSIMLNIAAGIAIGLEAAEVWAAMHAGDHPIYPDCRPEFIEALNECIQVATESGVWVKTPFIHIPKDEIVQIGTALGVDYSETWSCYEGGKVHCGRCGTCVERAEAFFLANEVDPTEYEDTEYWKSVVL